MAGLLHALSEYAGRLGQDALARDAKALVQAAGEPFLFVVVGEVKTGKSSFVNALLGQDVSAVAPEPCTDRILMMRHGPAHRMEEQGPLFSLVELPHPILQDIAIVDTPGVDSVVPHHQEITERFIPRSDLVLFVFSALNPYTRSAWDFLGLVSEEWRRKVVLVLNQADLATPAQLKVNREQVVELARGRGLGQPPVFVVSSALEAVQPELSGVEAVRRHIREVVTGGEHVHRKLVSLAEGGLRVLERMEALNAACARDLASDQDEAHRLRDRLEAAKAGALRDVEHLIGQVLKKYRRASEDYLTALELELAFTSMVRRSVLGLFKRRSSVPGLLGELNQAFKDTLEAQVEPLAREGSANLTHALSLQLSDMARGLRGLARDACGNLDAAALGRQRESVLRDVAQGLEELLSGEEEAGRVDPRLVSRMDPKAAIGGAMVLAGGLFVLSVKGVVLDVTGGVLAGAGVLLAGGVLAVGRPRLLRRLRQALEAGGQRLETELGALLGSRVDDFFGRIDERLAPLWTGLAQRRETLAHLEAEASSLRRAFQEQLDTAQKGD